MTEDNAYDLEYLPSFGVTIHQAPMCILRVFAVGMSGRDCAVYQGIVPACRKSDTAEWDVLVGEVRRGGDKLSEAEAREHFDLGELTYRV